MLSDWPPERLCVETAHGWGGPWDGLHLPPLLPPTTTTSSFHLLVLPLPLSLRRLYRLLSLYQCIVSVPSFSV